MNNGYSFFALISRLKYISRWSLMRNNTTENVGEHSHMAAVLAHALAVIGRDVYQSNANPDRAAAIALFHDASEIFTGDMPTPVKYFDPAIMEAYKNVESIASKKLLSALPAELRDSYTEVLAPDTGSDTYKLVKAADKLAAYIKCVEELKSGNPEFKLAAAECRAKLDATGLPEVKYFLEYFMPAFEATLDEMDFGIENN